MINDLTNYETIYDSLINLGYTPYAMYNKNDVYISR